MNAEPTNERLPGADLHAVHAQLQALYRKEYPEGAPNLWEVLLPKLPYFIRALVRRKLDVLVAEEIGADDGKTHENLTAAEKAALSAFFDVQVTRAHMEVGRDAALSNERHSIAHIDTQPPIIARNLIAVASSEDPVRLERLGGVFVDVDGTKTIVDCTSHAHAGKYLEALAEFQCNPRDRVAAWLAARNLRIDAFAVAGDEFFVLVRSEDMPITNPLLQEFSRELQAGIAEDSRLSGYISFDDPDFVIEYDDDWTDDDRAAYRRDPTPFAAKLAASRAKLPDRFVPSVSCGTATFLESLEEALSPDTEEAETLEELGLNAFRLMISRADERLKADKRVFREQLPDPKWKAFLLRNAENRRMQAELDDTRAKLAEALRRLGKLGGNTDLTA